LSLTRSCDDVTVAFKNANSVNIGYGLNGAKASRNL
jgi:hypothetical protein